VAGKDVGDESPARVGQRHRLVASVVFTARALDEAAAEEIAHHHCGVGLAAQELLAQLSLAERPVVEQRLQRAELPDGEAGSPHHVADANGQGLRRAHQLDVRVQRDGLGRAAPVAGRHGSNSNRL
jgi:hypothetical protein